MIAVMRTCLPGAIMLAALALAGATAQPPQKSKQDSQKRKAKFTVSKETTYLLGPLDKHGYIDYAAAVNERQHRGVTPASNANVLLWQAFGPRPFGEAVPADLFQQMGMQPLPAAGDYSLTSHAT